MVRTSSTRRLFAAGLLLGAIALGACGGGGDKSSPSSTPSAPGANVDPNATGTYTDPINKAKTTATNLNNQQQKLDRTTATDAT